MQAAEQGSAGRFGASQARRAAASPHRPSSSAWPVAILSVIGLVAAGIVVGGGTAASTGSVRIGAPHAAVAPRVAVQVASPSPAPDPSPSSTPTPAATPSPTPPIQRSQTSCVGIGPMAGNQARCAIAYTLYVPYSKALPKMDRYLTALQARRVEAVRHFPGWDVRLYLDGRFTKGMADVIRQLGYTVVHLPPSNRSLPEWHHVSSRLRVIDDPDVDVFMMRDLDSALSPRDAISVWVWLSSGVEFHSMHDNPAHSDVLMAGMWGGRSEAARRRFAPRGIDAFLAEAAANVDHRGNDQLLLTKAVWPHIEGNTLHMDMPQTYCKYDGKLCVPFPMAPHSGQVIDGFVGEVVASKALMPRPVDVECKALAEGLDKTAVFEEADLQQQWVKDAWPRMRSFCN